MQRFWRRTRPFDDDFFFSPYGSLVLFSFILDHFPADTLQIKTCLGFFFSISVYEGVQKAKRYFFFLLNHREVQVEAGGPLAMHITAPALVSGMMRPREFAKEFC